MTSSEIFTLPPIEIPSDLIQNGGQVIVNRTDENGEHVADSILPSLSVFIKNDKILSFYFDESGDIRKIQELDNEGFPLITKRIKNGQYHCDDGEPAFVIHQDTEVYAINGKIHRDGENSPALISYYSNGTVAQEAYAQNGILTRGDSALPSRSNYYRSGNIASVEYTDQNGLLHQDLMAAYRKYDNRTSKLIAETYYRHGEIFRENGPAVRRRPYVYGEDSYEDYFEEFTFFKNGTPSHELDEDKKTKPIFKKEP